MDLKITPEVLQNFKDKDSKKPHFRELYEKYDFLEAYAKHTDLRVKEDPKWAIGRGDEWESHGKLQLKFLMKEGMVPESYLLDVGCGVGRASRRFVPYLNESHYVGVDISPAALDHARELAKREGWESKAPEFVINSDLDLSPDREFDFIWAHSVFTHLPPQQIEKMIGNAATILRSGGKFCFTYKFAEKANRSGLKQFQYCPAEFADWSKPHGFMCESLDLVWPAHQRTIRLTKQ